MTEKAVIFDIQHFCVDDGPGIRTTVFFKGCNLKCFWCHNPESQNKNPELQFYKDKCIGCGKCNAVCPEGNARFKESCRSCGMCASACCAEALKMTGREMTVNELKDSISEDMDIYRRSGGGVTFSGGEPLLQKDILKQISQVCKELNIHTALETALNTQWRNAAEIIPYMDLIYCDIKAIDEQKHIEGTGVSNRLILENIRKLSQTDKDFIVRVPVVPGYNDNEIPKIAEFVKKLERVPSVELLPFHGICVSKYESLGRVFGAADIKTPSKETIDKLYGYFK